MTFFFRKTKKICNDFLIMHYILNPPFSPKMHKCNVNDDRRL